MRSAAALSFSMSSASVAATTSRRAGAFAEKARVVSKPRRLREASVSASLASSRALRAISVGSPLRASSSTSTVRRRSRSTSGPASSTVRWKLEPPKPKELTPARRRWSLPRIQGLARVLRSKGLLNRSSFGFGESTLAWGGRVLWCRANTALSRPAAPAVALVWPIWALTVPRAHHWRSSRPASSKTMRSPSNSAASPALVPVPWASTSSTVSGP